MEKTRHPEIVRYAKLEEIISGYQDRPILSARLEVKTSEDEENSTAAILSELENSINFSEKDKYAAERVIFEAVQNIAKHCCGESDVKIYASPETKKFISFFELSEDAQFGKEGHSRYQQMLDRAYKRILSPNYSQELMDFITNGETGTLEGFHLGTMIILLTPEVSKIGIADINSRAYFFFEYHLP